MRPLWTAILALAFAVPLQGQDVTLRERFQAYQERFELLAPGGDDPVSSCPPVFLDVFVFGDRLAGMGITESRVRTMAENLLRRAGIPWITLTVAAVLTPSGLYVDVETLYDVPAHHTSVRYAKQLIDLSDTFGAAVTWDRAHYGVTPPGDSGANHILQEVSGMLDNFIGEYLRVNAAACG